MIKKVTRHQWISVAAYYQAEARNFAPGRALDDWLAAENDYIKMQISYFLSKTDEDGVMTTVGLQQLAKIVGVQNADRIDLNIELIQAIQNTTHQRPCFRSDPGMICVEDECEWKAECKKLIAEWRR